MSNLTTNLTPLAFPASIVTVDRAWAGLGWMPLRRLRHVSPGRRYHSHLPTEIADSNLLRSNPLPGPKIPGS